MAWFPYPLAQGRYAISGLGRRAGPGTFEANSTLSSYFSFGGPPMQWLHSFVLASWSRWSRRRLTAIEHPLVRPPSARAHVWLLIDARGVNSIFLLAFAGGKGYGWWTLEAVFFLWALEAVWQRQVCGSKDGFMEVVLGSLEAVSILIVWRRS